MPRQRIHIDNEGTAHWIHDDALTALLKRVTPIEISTHVSHVEPDATGTQWTADMSPLRGPLLGPFEHRSQAIKAEVEYLRMHHNL